MIEFPKPESLHRELVELTGDPGVVVVVNNITDGPEACPQWTINFRDPARALTKSYRLQVSSALLEHVLADRRLVILDLVRRGLGAPQLT